MIGSPRCSVMSRPQKEHIELGLLNLLVVPTLVRPGPMETYGLAVVLGVAKLVQLELLYRTGACVPLWSCVVRLVTTDLDDRIPVLLISRWQVPKDLRLWHRLRCAKRVLATFSLLFRQTHGALWRTRSTRLSVPVEWMWDLLVELLF